MKTLLLLTSIIMIGCIPNPLMTEPDKQPELNSQTIQSGVLHSKDLIETPGIWYWILEIKGARKVYLDGRELEENYDYRLKGDSILIFEVIEVDSVDYRIVVY